MLDATGPLLLISAPAGYGKTTLLVQALSQRGGAVAWVTVDSADNDPLRFWTHVIASVLGESPMLDTLVAEMAAGVVARNRAVDALLAEIESLDVPVALVLDDLHEVTGNEILETLGRVVTNPPANLLVVASTRADPALPTGRLRAQSRLTEIRANDLAFTTDEAAAFFGDHVDDDAVETIISRTEGWPTAVRLLEVASTAARSGAELLDAAVGANPDLADFLSEEALTVQRPELQQFLLETAPLDDLTPTVCDTVTGRPGSLSLLRELATNQVFTVLVEPASNTYRYHHLFREFLRARGEALPIVDRRARAQRAADHYAEQGHASEAVRMALMAANDEMAVELILDFNLAYAQSGWIATVFDWLNAYGRERVKEHPELSLLYAWALLNLGRYEDLADALAVPGLQDPTVQGRYGPLGAQIGAVRSHWMRHTGNAIASRSHGEEGQAFAADTASVAHAVPGAAAGLAAVLLGEDATETLERAVSVGLRSKIDSSAMSGYSGLALHLSRDPDRMDEARAFADQALAFCSTPALTRFHQPAIPYVVKARACVAQGRVGDAATFATRALDIATDAHEPLFALLAHVELARSSHLANDRESCRAHLRAAEQLLTVGSGDHLADLVRRTHNETRFTKLNGRADLPPGAAELTDRELAVVRLLPHGLSRKELAEQLFISENTIKTHLTSIRHKLGISGRADIAARARELQIID